MKQPLWLVMTLIAMAGVAMIAATPPPHLPRALAAQEKLAQERPADPVVLNDLGNLLRLAGRLEESEAAYRRALTLDPNRVSTHFNLALLLQQENRLEAALEEYRQVVALRPDHAWAHYQAGAILESRGATAAATRAYARAFALDPQLSFPDVNPHVIENHLLTEALLLSQRQAEAIPQAPNAYDDPAWIASLLLPSSPSAEEEKEAREAEGARSRQEAAMEKTPPSERREKPRVGSAQPPRSLSEEDLDPGSTQGQAVPQGVPSSRSTGGVRSPSSSRQGGFAVPGYVPGRPSQGQGIQSDRSGQMPSGRVITPPLPPGRRTPGGTRFQPGLPSTGRLEIEVLPNLGPQEPQRAG